MMGFLIGVVVGGTLGLLVAEVLIDSGLPELVPAEYGGTAA